MTIRRHWVALGWLLRLGVAVLIVAAAVVAGTTVAAVRGWRALEKDRIVPVAPEDLHGYLERATLPGGSATQVVLLGDPTRAWAERWRMVSEAKHRIDVAYFNLDPDIFGLSLLGAFLERADQGVQVRVLLDGFATKMSRTLDGDDILDEMGSHHNITVRVFRPMSQRIADFALHWRAGDLIASQHDKILVVDGEAAMTGGRNVAEAYFTPADQPGRQYMDFDVLLRSPLAASSLRVAFDRLYDDQAIPEGESANFSSRTMLLEHARAMMDAWLRGAPLPPAPTEGLASLHAEWQSALASHPELEGFLQRSAPEPDDVAEVRVADSVSSRVPHATEIACLLLSLIESAQREVLIVNPYLVLSESTTEVLSRASERGVRITLVTNSPRSSDSTISQAFFTEQWPALLARVPSARLFVTNGDDTLHAKLATVDDRIAVIGTYNLDPTAMQFDSELAVAIWSPRVSAALRRYAATWLDGSPPLALEYRIERDGNGQVVRDAQGEPVTAFGPEEHVDPERLADVAWQRRWLARVRWLLDLDPLLRSQPPEGAPPVSRARGAPSP